MAHGGQVEVLRNCYESCHARWQLGLGQGCGGAGGDVQSVLEMELSTLWVGWIQGRRSGRVMPWSPLARVGG